VQHALLDTPSAALPPFTEFLQELQENDALYITEDANYEHVAELAGCEALLLRGACALEWG
jgi:hypothetical protein